MDRHVIGQEHAKKVLSVAVHNHYKRLSSELGIGTVSSSESFMSGELDDIEIEKVSEFESNLFDYLEANASDQLSSIKESGDLRDDTSKSLDKLISDFKNSFAV